MDTQDITGSGLTHVGKVRSVNEDSYMVSHPVYVVSDGMGGHAQGAAASQAVVKAFEHLSTCPDPTPADVAASLTIAREQVEALNDDASARPPGATVTGAVFAHQSGLPCWIVFNVGDSRTYRLQGKTLEQVTVDHSARQEYANLSPEEQQRRVAPQSNIITRVIGGGGHVRQDADIWILTAEPGDRLLICSDGLCRHVDDSTITHILTTQESADVAAQNLLDLALDGGGRDNISVVVVDAERSAHETLDVDTQPCANLLRHDTSVVGETL